MIILSKVKAHDCWSVVNVIFWHCQNVFMKDGKKYLRITNVVYEDFESSIN